MSDKADPPGEKLPPMYFLPKHGAGLHGNLKTKKRKKSGPPPTLICDDRTLFQLFNIAKYNVTYEIAAAWMGVSKGTFTKFINKHDNAKEAWKAGKAIGQGELTELVWNKASAGEWPALQHLLKHVKGEHDKREQTIDITDNRTTEQLITGITAIIKQVGSDSTTRRSETVTIDAKPGEAEELQALPETSGIPRIEPGES